MLNEPTVRSHKLKKVLSVLLVCASASPLISKDFSSGSWGPEFSSLGLYMDLKADGTYVKTMSGPGGMTCTGKWTIKEGAAMLAQGSKDHNGSVDCSPSRCTSSDDHNSIYRNRKLDCKMLAPPRTAKKTTDSFWLQNALVPKGTNKTIDGVPATLMGLRTGKVTYPLKIRARPNPKSPAYTIRPPGGAPAWTSLPAGHELIIIARTRTTEKIGKHNNYWYYVNLKLPEDEFWEVSSSFGWMFAEWIKLD